MPSYMYMETLSWLLTYWDENRWSPVVSIQGRAMRSCEVFFVASLNKQLIQTVALPVITDAITLMLRYRNAHSQSVLAFDSI